MSKVTDNYNVLSMKLRMGYDPSHNVIYGIREGYEVLVYCADARYPYMLTVSISARNQMGSTLTKEEKAQFKKEVKGSYPLNQKNTAITCVVKNAKNQDKLFQLVEHMIMGLTGFLRVRGYVSCCQICGQVVETTSYVCGKSYVHMCPECANKTRQDMMMESEKKGLKSENVIGGIVGALLGSIIGLIVMLLISQLGYVAALSGVVMAVCTLKGYDMLAGKLSKKGVVISCIIMFAMIYFGNRLDWAITVYQAFGSSYDISFTDAFQLIPELLAEEVIESGTYWYNCILLYVFTIGGAIPTVISKMNESKTKFLVEQIGATNVNIAV